MSSLDKPSVRISALILVIVLVGVATHYLDVDIDANHKTLDQREADDKSDTR
jgi:hypothetical protein